MKKLIVTILFLTLLPTLYAQHKGNYDQTDQSAEMISRQNVAHGGNAPFYNPNIYVQANANLNPTNSITIEVKALQNVKASSYTAIFNLSQIGTTAKETDSLSALRIDNVRNKLLRLGIPEKDIVVDVISFVPVYETVVEKKLFSKKYNEIPIGFELQQNLHIQFKETNEFPEILTACAESEIYNLVKVDYFIENIAHVYKTLQTELLKLIEDKKTYYKTLGFDVSQNYNAYIADNKYCYFPKDFYKHYQAYNSISFEAIKQNKGVTTARKQTSYYYQPITYENYDIVINPSILEPVVQVGMHIKLQYTPKPEEKVEPITKSEIEHKYYVISPNGAVDIKELKTN